MLFPALLFLGSALLSLISLYRYGLPKGKLYLVFPAIDLFLALSVVALYFVGWFFSWLYVPVVIIGFVYIVVRSRYLKKMYPRSTDQSQKSEKEDKNNNGD